MNLVEVVFFAVFVVAVEVVFEVVVLVVFVVFVVEVVVEVEVFAVDSVFVVGVEAEVVVVVVPPHAPFQRPRQRLRHKSRRNRGLWCCGRTSCCTSNKRKNIRK